MFKLRQERNMPLLTELHPHVPQPKSDWQGRLAEASGRPGGDAPTKRRSLSHTSQNLQRSWVSATSPGQRSFVGGLACRDAGQILARERNVAENDFLAPDAVNARPGLNRFWVGRKDNFRFLNFRVQRANAHGKQVAASRPSAKGCRGHQVAALDGLPGKAQRDVTLIGGGSGLIFTFKSNRTNAVRLPSLRRMMTCADDNAPEATGSSAGSSARLTIWASLA